MKKQKDPAFLFYSQDFIVGTIFMTKEEIGVYILLLAHQHQKGYLTNEMIGKITEGIEYPNVMKNFIQGDNGNWINVRLGKEVMRRKKYAQDQRARALKRWSKDANAPAELDADSMPRDVTDTVNDTQTITINTKHTSNSKRDSPDLSHLDPKLSHLDPKLKEDRQTQDFSNWMFNQIDKARKGDFTGLEDLYEDD